MSMKLEQSKEVEGPIYSFFTTFAVFTNFTPALLVLMIKQNNAIEVYFSMSYKTLKQTKDKAKKSEVKMKINIIIAAPILRGIIIEFYETFTIGLQSFICPKINKSY